MKQLYIILISFCTVFALATSCSKGGKTVSVAGEWELCGYETKSVTIGEQEVSVFVNFINGGIFELYQKTGSEMRYTKYTGTWALSGDIISGNYEDGSQWASAYTVSLSGDNLIMTSDSTPSEVMSFRRSSIQDSIMQ